MFTTFRFEFSGEFSREWLPVGSYSLVGDTLVSTVWLTLFLLESLAFFIVGVFSYFGAFLLVSPLY